MNKIIKGGLDSGETNPAPEMECWTPEGESNGGAMVIFPGGAYAMLAEHEGRGYAGRFSKAGWTCFVVNYRLGSAGFRHPAMIEDALAAIGTVRSMAGEFGVDPGRVGVIGSSAGGHLAAHAMTAWDTYPEGRAVRPDFGVLCYPVITSTGEFHHAGSMKNLLGDDPSPDLLEAVSCEKNVTAETPPCFLWHTGEDVGVSAENSLAFASALRRHGVEYELHIYAKGRHGLGLGAPFPWADECLRWLSELDA